ncbi:MAG: hypothetical protein J5I93_11925 [Pirellulaceae bacterium]|nr:hypothetical protein [Pirellulaceae bacterium]
MIAGIVLSVVAFCMAIFNLANKGSIQGQLAPLGISVREPVGVYLSPLVEDAPPHAEATDASTVDFERLVQILQRIVDASEQSGDAFRKLETRIDELERDLRELNRIAPQPPGPSAALGRHYPPLQNVQLGQPRMALPVSPTPPLTLADLIQLVTQSLGLLTLSLASVIALLKLQEAMKHSDNSAPADVPRPGA